MGDVGVSSINLIFARCMGHSRWSSNPITVIYSWVISGLRTMRHCFAPLSRRCRHVMQPRTRPRHPGDRVALACVPSESIMNAGLAVVEEQERSSRVTGSITQGKQLEVSSCHNLCACVCVFFFLRRPPFSSAVRISLNFSPGVRQHACLALEKLQTPATKSVQGRTTKGRVGVAVMYAASGV